MSVKSVLEVIPPPVPKTIWFNGTIGLFVPIGPVGPWVPAPVEPVIPWDPWGPVPPWGPAPPPEIIVPLNVEVKYTLKDWVEVCWIS